MILEPEEQHQGGGFHTAESLLKHYFLHNKIKKPRDRFLFHFYQCYGRKYICLCTMGGASAECSRLAAAAQDF